MKAFSVDEANAGRRLDHYLQKLLPQATYGFLCEMLRKKNITLNGRRAAGGDILAAGDVVTVYFSDETFAKFSADEGREANEWESLRALPMQGLFVLCEEASFLALDKPAGMLSQKALDADVSANERMIGYLIRKGSLSREELKSARPSVCNRLDRNTSGILLAGKTPAGLRDLSEALRSRSAEKEYRAIVCRQMNKSVRLEGYLYKDREKNTVRILTEPAEGAVYVCCVCRPLFSVSGLSYLSLNLLTGRSHQLRAQLAAANYPIIGDPKYGDPVQNRRYRKEYGITRQMLHAYRVTLPGRAPIISPLPADMKRLLSAAAQKGRRKEYADL